MHKQFAVLVVSGVVLAACSDPVTPSGPARLAPIADASSNIATQYVPDEYIVVLRTPPRGAAALQAELQGMVGIASVQVTYVYGTALSGFAIKATSAALAALRANPNVDFVERSQIYSTGAVQTPTPSWGLDRIDQNNLPLNTSFTYPTGGSGVHIYIIDTGIRLTHSDFTGRVGNGFDAVTSGGNANDCNGHGTHVAGTAGGTVYGIMKTATMHPVRVLGCAGSGTTAGVIAGINWVAANAIQPAVSNMSLGGSFSSSINTAVNAMVSAGVVSAVAAGNDALNACNFSPASAANAITVGATTTTDARSSFSNFGTCLDIFAPGSSIVSDWASSDVATASASGTSMASPHVAGAAALYRSFNPTHTPTQVASALTGNATQNVVGNPGTGSPNRLLYMGFIGGAPPPNNQNPVANFSVNCVVRPDGIGADCQADGTSSTDPDGTIAAYNWTSTNRPAKTGPVISYAYPVGTSQTITLTVSDNLGGTNSKSTTFTVGSSAPPPPPPPPPGNQSPVANISYNCVPRTPNVGSDCTFNGTSSTDADGSIVSFVWSTPGRPGKTGSIVSYPFPAGATPTVTLTVTDNQGATGSKSITFTVP